MYEVVYVCIILFLVDRKFKTSAFSLEILFLRGHFIAVPFGGVDTVLSESRRDRNNRANSSNVCIMGPISQPHSLIIS